MGLGDWINRYILEVKKEEGAPAPKPDDPPEVQARAGTLVPTQPASQVISELPRPNFSELESQLDSRPEPAPPKPPPVPAAPTKEALDDGKDPPVSVQQVYAAAKLGKPLHGFTLEKVSGMLSDPRMAALDESNRANAVAVMLDTAGVKIADVVKDAADRDAALDRFEGFLTDKLISLEVEIEKENGEIELELQRVIKRKEEQIAMNRERVLVKERELARFRRVKRAEEERLFDVVRHFTAENPISVTQFSSGAPSAPPAAPAHAPTEPPPASGDEVSYKDIAAQLREDRADD